MSYRIEKSKAEKAAFVAAYEEEQSRPLRQLEQKYARTSNELAIAERTLAAMELLSTPDNKELSSRVKAFQPANPPESVDSLRLKIQNSLRLATDNLIAQGYKFTDSAEPKIRRVLGLNGKLDFTTPEALYSIVGYMIEVAALVEGSDINSPAPVIESTPEPAVDPLAALESQETVTREGAKKARRMAEDLAVDAQRPMFHEFIGHMRDVWNHPMYQADQERCVNFIVKYDLPWNAKTYNIVRQQVLGCRLPDEQLSIAIETTEKPLSDYAVRQDFAQRRRQIEGTV